MKKILLIVLATFALSSFAQEKPKEEKKEKKKLDCYIGTSLSTSTGNNFNQGSYTGIELGVCAKNMMFGYATGRGNLDFTSDGTQHYWGELKAYASHQFGSVKGFVIAGWGQYYTSTHSFIEYGAGGTYSVKKFDFCVTVSNWDNTWYVSPGICFNFSL